MADQIRIFLSSTQLDLSQARSNIIKYLSVLKSDLLAMEVFGSDESKPVDFCLNQVRKCNIFIGMYAERYGTVDHQTGKSITELEYIEAREMLKTGKLKTLLLYLIDQKANWPLNLIERDPHKMAKLDAFKKEILSMHTVSFFQSADDLPFFILRDVIKKIGIVSKRLFIAKKYKTVSQRSSLDRPLGMEYYGEELAQLFFGRNVELDDIQEQVLRDKMSLLIGSSGVGKTSLLYAGLINRVKELGWQTALVRPLTEPIKNLKRFIWDQLLEGDLPHEFDLTSVIRAASTGHSGKQILVIIDQFEDILMAKDSSDIEVLTTNLFNIFNTVEENLRILICYRGDVEPHVGTIWQKISGSPQGLPRSYLGSLRDKNAKNVLEETFNSLGITAKESSKKEPSFIDTVIADLKTESLLSGHTGVYPPFIQMVIARIFDDKDRNGVYYSKQYHSAGQSRRIIADFLMTQLKYLGKRIEVGKSILIALVSSYGAKAQKTFKEIAKECLIPNNDVEIPLNLLIDLRLVRSVDGAYEIAHDFLGKIITSELVSTEEREAKKFKDLLASRTAAYESTKAGLTSSEHLHIYRYRNKILCVDEEFKLLLGSFLTGNGPISYWAKRYPKSILKGWVYEMLSDLENEIEGAAYRYLMKLGERPALSLLAEAFSDYKEQHELSRYISDLATNDDIELLIKLNRKRAEEVVSASQDALVRLIKSTDTTIFEKMAKSNSRNTILTYEKMALKLSEDFTLDEIRNGLQSKKLWRRVLSIYSLGRKGTIDDLRDLQNFLKKKISQKIRTAITKTIARLSIRLSNERVLKESLNSRNRFTVEKTLEAIDTPTKLVGIDDLFALYQDYPFLVSKAILTISRPSDIPKLRSLLSKIPLEPAARDIVYALCKFGHTDDFSFLLNLFLNYNGEIKFWNPFAVAYRISDMATKAHLPLLKRLINSKDFWRYYREEDRPKPGMPLKDYQNVYFIKRLTGRSFGKVATRREFPTVFKMLRHDYWIVRNAALEAIRRYGNANDLRHLLEMASGGESDNEGLIEAICILDDGANPITSDS